MKRFGIYLKDIQPLLKEFNPITICLSWHEYENRDIRAIFKEAGLAVTTIGHRIDTNFLYKFRDLVLQHSYVSSNEFGTAIFYSLYLGRKVFLKGTIRDLDELLFNPNRYDPTTMTITMEKAKENSRKVYQMYPELRWENFDDKCHWWIGNYEIGLKLKKTPEDLRKVLGWTPARFVSREIKKVVEFTSYEKLAVYYLPRGIKKLITTFFECKGDKK